MYLSIRACACVGLFALFAAALFGAAQKTKLAFLDPREAGPDFQVQGEYQLAKAWGAQVIALGDGKFDAVLYPGGLPGAGWNGKEKLTLTGETADGTTRFKGDKVDDARIEDGTFTLVLEDGKVLKLKKVERKSPTLAAKPPKGATVLFDGSDVEHWQNGKLEEGDLLGVGTRTKEKFGDFTLHLEFRTPFMPNARGQARGNSGMYLLDQYEVQILDSFGLEGKDNECGGIYREAPPRVNMCLPPLSWQTYDVEFKAARFKDGKKVSPAVVTIRHNGVAIHDKLEFKGPTPGGGQSDERPGRLYLQDHRDPVRFRNIWIVEK